MRKKEHKPLSKITKLNLVIYFSLIFAMFIACLISCLLLNDSWQIMWGFLACLGPSLCFAFISIFLPIDVFFNIKNKKLVILYSFLYAIKYILVFLAPILCVVLTENDIFNRWSLAVTTLIAPITIIIIKLIFAIKDSKSSKKEQKTPTNSIKF